MIDTRTVSKNKVRIIAILLLIVATGFLITPVAAAVQMDWDLATDTAAFSGRNSHKVLTYNDRLWVIGGYDTAVLNDVWYSYDGAAWTQATPSAQFLPRMMCDVVVFNGKMWVIGGLTGSPQQYLNDVWSSTDGVTWIQETSSAGFSPRYGHSVLAYNGKLWVIGGYDGNFRNDVWSSTDGVNWIQETPSAAFPARHLPSALVYNGNMWLMNGEIHEYPWTYSNDVWYSADGVTWTQATASAEFDTRSGACGVVYDDKMWVISGVGDAYGNVRYNDAWYSTDGATWTMADSASLFPSRYYAAATVFNGRIWVIGGSGGGQLRDVWYAPKDDVPSVPEDVKKYAPNLWFEQSEQYYPVDPFFYTDDISQISGEVGKNTYLSYTLDEKMDKFTVLYRVVDNPIFSDKVYEYWFYYPYNDFINKHYHDWEKVFVFVDRNSGEVSKVIASAHSVWDPNNVQNNPGVGKYHADILIEGGSHAAAIDGNNDGHVGPVEFYEISNPLNLLIKSFEISSKL